MRTTFPTGGRGPAAGGEALRPLLLLHATLFSLNTFGPRRKRVAVHNRGDIV